MKDDVVRWEEEKRSYETLFWAVLGKRTKIFDIRKNERGIGYTDESGNIHLAKSDPIFSRLSAEKRSFFRKGVFAHEMLHQCFTDMAYTSELLASDKYTQAEKKVIMSFANLIEDPAIEYQAPSAFGGNLLAALRFTIAHIYKKSPSIDGAASAFEQLQDALIQFGDMGIVKGSFTYPAAYDLFKKIAPEFNAAILNPVSKERIDMAVKWMNDTRSLWEDEDPAILSQEIKQVQKDNAISTPLETNSPAISSDEVFATAEDAAAERRKDFAEALSDDEETEDFFQDEKEANKEANKEVNSNTKLPQTEQPPKKERPVAEIDDFSVDSHVSCKNKRIPARNNDIAVYNEITARYAQTIRLLESSLRRIFMSDTGGIVRKTSGKYNVKRGAVGTSVNVFDKKKAPKDLKDMAIFLLIDESGSMYGKKCSVAMDSAIILAEVLAKLDLPCYVMGFTADCGDTQVYHRHFVTWSNTQKERYSLVQISGLYNNDDAYSIKYATELLKKTKAEHKLLFVISDGLPSCWRISGKTGVEQTAIEVRNAKKAIKLLGLGIGLRSSDHGKFEEIYGRDFVMVSDPSQLAATLAVQLKRVIRSI